MATIVTGTLPAEEFALRDSLATLPDVEFEVEQIVESGENAVMPVLWVRGAAPDVVDETFERDPSVTDPSLLLDLDGDLFYRMEWIYRVQLVFQILTDSEATVTAAYGAGDMVPANILSDS
ncbi:bacterio-opsin activator domain-containing protein [Halomarina halobia]|uniref:Bacterio-opsin activator domain-containing protein n=1 Tax=Halomarina halobia TaxID=3033386 RepID=A0ABD6AER2_9EURY